MVGFTTVTMALYRLSNKTIYSHWGCTESMTKLFGYENPEQRPMAELWMGAHASAPSVILDETPAPLDTWINSQSDKVLGKEVSDRFSAQLPYLFKVLSARSPLSIQSHPSKSQAEAGWNRENLQGIPLSAPNRSYKDDNHKPELVYALTQYHALNGFREINDIVDLCESLECSDLNHIVAPLKNDGSEGSLKKFYSELLHCSDQKNLVTSVINSCVKKSESVNLDRKHSAAFNLILKLHHYYPYDIGILGPLFLNYVVLSPGEAMFLKSGTLHAYIQGTALELMANSDNVIRGGLTPKYIDKDELLETVNFEPLKSDNILLKPNQIDRIRTKYNAGCKDFSLSIVDLSDQHFSVDSSYEFSSTSADIIFSIDGDLTLSADRSEPLELKRGQSCFVTAEVGKLTIQGQGKVAIASCGI